MSRYSPRWIRWPVQTVKGVPLKHRLTIFMENVFKGKEIKNKTNFIAQSSCDFTTITVLKLLGKKSYLMK